ncbi:MAG: hypothetical protein A2066_00230 [Bacteroidetes bacterium GWB2_41_8]|nr:MAG: hypothetical protein A2066_00230 [Bacteroidetes bacterium GWB2_41_8]
MKKLFDISFEDDALEFIEKLEPKAAEKVFKILERAQHEQDPKFFSKLTKSIWEFRIKFFGQEYRLLAFWHTEVKSLVICTHGFEKKTQKTPPNEIKKAEERRKNILKEN